MTISAMNGIVNALSIDVEDYFQVSALAPYIARDEWNEKEFRVERNIDRILEMLDDIGVKATFFTLAWVAEKQPDIVRKIVNGGHELASHGYSHKRVSELSPADFSADIRIAKLILEQQSGVDVRGYRAPSFSIGDRNQWALDCIRESGYQYSSSIYPVRHDHYGMPNAPRFPFSPIEGLLEIPIATVKLLGRNLPAGGGGFFRMLPYELSRRAIERINMFDHRPAMFYFHPWEIDFLQPRVHGLDPKTRFRHYVNLHKMEAKLRRLLRDFRWGRVDDVYVNAGTVW